MGPTEANPIIPKPSNSFLTLPVEQIPIPKDSRIGTVIGPVVTPPESNAIPRNSVGVKIAMIMTAMYEIVRISLIENLNTILHAAMTRNAATPIAMA